MIHKYNKDTKEYIGSMSKKIDPLESELRGEEVLVIPPFCTLVEPPKPEEGKVVIFDEAKNEWIKEEDHRGEVVYDSNGTEIVITSTGKLPEGCSKERPIDVKDLKDEKRDKITLDYYVALASEIKVKTLNVKVSDDVMVRGKMEIAKDFPTVPFEQEGETVFVDYETLDLARKTLYVRNMLLALKKQEMLNKLKRMKDKDKIANFSIDYNVEKETKKLAGMTDEEINKYFAGE